MCLYSGGVHVQHLKLRHMLLFTYTLFSFTVSRFLGVFHVLGTVLVCVCEFFVLAFDPHHFVVGVASQLLPACLCCWRLRPERELPGRISLLSVKWLVSRCCLIPHWPWWLLCRSHVPCLIELARRWGLTCGYNGRKLLCWIMSVTR